jgi:hypothetical protein
MYVYRNRRYEEEIARKRNTDTHTDTNKRLRARDMIQGEIVLRGGAG